MTDLPFLPPKQAGWRPGWGAVLAGFGLVLLTVGQDVVSNLLAAQLEAYVPQGLRWVFILVGLVLLLGGAAMVWQRWQGTSTCHPFDKLPHSGASQGRFRP